MLYSTQLLWTVVYVDLHNMSLFMYCLSRNVPYVLSHTQNPKNMLHSASLLVYITKYGSTLYIGMDEVLAILPVHSNIPIFTFIFSHNPLLTLQDDSQGQYVCLQKIRFELDH